MSSTRYHVMRPMDANRDSCRSVMLVIMLCCCCMQMMMLTTGLTLSKPPAKQRRRTLRQKQKLEYLPKQTSQGELEQSAVSHPTARWPVISNGWQGLTCVQQQCCLAAQARPETGDRVRSGRGSSGRCSQAGLLPVKVCCWATCRSWRCAYPCHC